LGMVISRRDYEAAGDLQISTQRRKGAKTLQLVPAIVETRLSRAAKLRL
jgi:hypothetical protein